MKYIDFFRSDITDKISSESYDIFVSAYNNNERVVGIYNKINATNKYYLLFSEYNIGEPPKDNISIQNNDDLIGFVKGLPKNENICIDITGFVRPYLILFVKALKKLELSKVTFIYSEPVQYDKHQDTKFSKGERLGVSSIEGFAVESGDIPNDKKILIIGAGFESKSFEEVISKYKDIKTDNQYILIGFPSLRPDMFQQSMLRVPEIEKHYNKFKYASASNPFMTAQKIHDTVNEFRGNGQKKVGVYLAPLSTKPQVLGFALYALRNEDSDSLEVNVIYPFVKKYSEKTSKGIARTWQYKINFSQDVFRED
ncbi:hypothetical protein BSPWISOX_788 [uncultured Gammaproteobacteria bacterium]|jgi:hypothetical protein|nr:hypothetical protein BSPWISOX_788 [uncultured Gammaproteobacteria bacterium]VVM25328.1 hypothetical protein BSPWISOXPB_5248 [uncultured Gammaproteobacteria bacterium]